MNRFRLAYLGRVPRWGWLLVGLAVLGMVAFAFRRQFRYLVKVAKALATDERLPRPLRWGLKLALAMKVVPFPDLGIDELILVVIGVLLVTVYRPTLRAILDESRATPPASPGHAR
jgi:hypothetical protein